MTAIAVTSPREIPSLPDTTEPGVGRGLDGTPAVVPELPGNSVDWWEWSDEAFAAAHESFEDAEAMNAGFVNIKVDREERPDIDAVYLDATTALTGHGGWPMTCLLTQDAAPFYAGTYLPKARWAQLRAD